MTQNPFDPAGGGFDMGTILQQAQQMQERIVEAQAELEQAEVEGSSAGVKVRVNGSGELRSVDIPTGTFDGSDAESLADLGDLVVAAYRDARAEADKLAAEKLGPLTGGLGEPGAAGEVGGFDLGALGFGPSGTGPDDGQGRRAQVGILMEAHTRV